MPAPSLSRTSPSKSRGGWLTPVRLRSTDNECGFMRWSGSESGPEFRGPIRRSRIGERLSQSSQWIAAARLLRRTGFGAAGPQVDALAGKDWSQYLDGALGSDPDADLGARATPM